MFSASFYQKKSSKKAAPRSDRFIASQKSDEEMSFQHSKLMGSELKSTPLTNALTDIEWKVSPEQINNASIREFSLRPAPKAKQLARQAYTLSAVPKLKDKFSMDNSEGNNPICWGKGNTLYVATKKSVFSCDYDTGNYSKLLTQDGVGALAYDSHQDSLVYGTGSGQLRMYSVDQKQIYLQTQADQLIRSISTSGYWHSYYVMTSLYLHHLDIRQGNKPSAYKGIGSIMFKLGMVKRGTDLAISDSEDGVLIYDERYMAKAKVHLNGHKIPTKAMAFAPHSERLFATGGGEKDNTIKIWDLQTASVKTELNIEREVCNLHWLDNHGLFAAEGKGIEDDFGNGVSCWSVNQKGLSLDSDAIGHDDRVLFSAQHPRNPGLIATAAADNKLSFWSVGNVNRGKSAQNVKKDDELVHRFQIR